MEQKLNIIEILKDKASGTKLWSSLFGDVYFDSASANLVTVSHHKALAKFWRNAKLYDYDEAEPTLFPSKEMRDWSKFAWKKGDVLVSMEGSKILFDKWANEDYTKFLGKIKVLGNSHCYDTANYSLASKEEALEFIKSVEEINNGKLNRETLEIEKSEFKDGDIVVTDTVPSMCYSKCIFILKGDFNTCKYRANSYIFYNINNNHISFNIVDRTIKDRNIHLATEEEKQQLFDALAKKGKTWDSVKKQIVDLKPKWTPKPFDRVITRTPETTWTANFFSHIDSDGIKNCIDDRYIMCLPYNDETAKLIGTTNNWRG